MLKFYRQIALVALLCGPALLMATSETLYRWDDANGNPVISDRPPPIGTPYSTVDPNYSGIRRMGGSKTPSATAPSSAQLPRVPPSSSVPRDATQAPVKKNPTLCQEAQDNIFKLETFARIRMEDPVTGDIRFLSDEERQNQLDSARAQAELHCN